MSGNQQLKDLNMKNPIDNYWKVRLEAVKETLEKNNFEVFVVDTAADAKEIALSRIIPGPGYQERLLGGVHVLCGHRPFPCPHGRQTP
jgi:hypothetical protein